MALRRGLPRFENGFLSLPASLKCDLRNLLAIHGHLYPSEFSPPSVIHGFRWLHQRLASRRGAINDRIFLSLDL